MKSIILLLTSPFIVILTLAGLQSIEWHQNEGSEIPLLPYLILLISTVWCFLVANTNKQEMLKALEIIERWLENLVNKHKK